jgi:4-hydroxy-tetrahydrodipicolinate reductase
MSVGVNVVFQLLASAARALREGFDIEIIEAHHRHKVDAPERHRAEDGRDRRRGARPRSEGLRRLRARRRHRRAATRRRSASRPVRGGDIVGDHTVLFAGTGERIEITHRSTAELGYAPGQPARRALSWPTAHGAVRHERRARASPCPRGRLAHFWTQGDAVSHAASRRCCC